MREPERESPASEPVERASAGDDERERATAHEQPDADDEVTLASEGSFPASDPPPWTSSVTRGS